MNNYILKQHMIIIYILILDNILVRVPWPRSLTYHHDSKEWWIPMASQTRPEIYMPARLEKGGF